MEWAREFQWEVFCAGMRYRWWFLGGVFTCALIGLCAATTIRPVYRAGATLVVEAGGKDSTGAVPEEVMRTLEQSSSRPEVEWAVWRELAQGRGTRERSRPGVRGAEVRALEKSRDAAEKPRNWNGTARWRRGTALMDLEYEALKPAEAEEAVGFWAEELVRVQELENRGRIWNASLEAEEARVRASVLEAEGALRRFRSEQGALVLEGARAAIQEEVRAIRERLAGLESEGARLEGDWNQVSRMQGWEGLVGISSLARMEEVGAARTRLQTAQTVLAGMDARYGKRHPRRVQAERETSAARNLLRDALERGLVQLAGERSAYKARRAAWEGQLLEKEKGLGFQQKAAAEDQLLQRTVASEQALWEGLVARRRQLGFSGESGGYRVRILSGAALLGGAQRPAAMRWGVAGALLGLALSGGCMGLVAARKVRWPWVEGRFA